MAIPASNTDGPLRGCAPMAVAQTKPCPPHPHDTTTDDGDSSASTFARFTMAVVRANISILIFTCVHLVTLVVNASYRSYIIFHSKTYNASYTEWTECAFLHFDGANPDAWKHVCGAVPQKRLPFSIMFMGVFTISMYGVFLSAMHFTVIVREAFLLKFIVWCVLLGTRGCLRLSIRFITMCFNNRKSGRDIKGGLVDAHQRQQQQDRDGEENEEEEGEEEEEEEKEVLQGLHEHLTDPSIVAQRIASYTGSSLMVQRPVDDEEKLRNRIREMSSYGEQDPIRQRLLAVIERKEKRKMQQMP
jgi:hypothetical protein